MMVIMVVSIIGTIVIAILSVMTLTEGYAFEHTVDPPVNQTEEVEKSETNDIRKESF